jgi:hypothetical protein
VYAEVSLLMGNEEISYPGKQVLSSACCSSSYKFFKLTCY